MTEQTEENRRVFVINAELIKNQQEKMKKITQKLVTMFDDAVSSFKDEDRYFILAQWAEASSKLANLATKQAIAVKETLFAQGLEFQVADDVQMEMLQKALHVPTRGNETPQTVLEDDDEVNELDNEE